MKNTVTKEEIDALLASARRSTRTIGVKTTLVVVTLPNGFEIAATSACVDPENYDMAVGEKIAMKRRTWFRMVLSKSSANWMFTILKVLWKVGLDESW